MKQAPIILILVAAAAGLTWWCLRKPSNVTPQPKQDEVKQGVVTDKKAASNKSVSATSPFQFARQVLPFTYIRGDSGDAWPLEPTGGGVAVLDYDCDGTPDLFFPQGHMLPTAPPDRPHDADCLLRSTGNRKYQPVSVFARIKFRGYGQGVSVADYDNDGFPDIYVTRYGTNTLWQNQGDGTFLETTDKSGTGDELWGLGAAFADIDNDGDLDLYVANYSKFDPADAPFARNAETGEAEYGTPANFDGLPDVLYLNDGAGRFTNYTEAAGIEGTMRGMGVLATDFDRDGHVDFLIANDAQNNTLWHNQGDNTFRDVAEHWGVAVNGEGNSEANMGIAYGDTNQDGADDVLISHYHNEHDTLWCLRPGDRSRMIFRDETRNAGLGIDSRKLTGWGTIFDDLDHDGKLDLLVVNGHIRTETNRAYDFYNPPILWHNAGNGKFSNVTETSGQYFTELHQARGLVSSDLDQDGDLDLVIVHHYTPSVILWNESEHAAKSVLIRVTSASDNRDAIGTRVTLTGSDWSQTRTLYGGGSYISSRDPELHFGLPDSNITSIEVTWPSGRVQRITTIPPGSRWQFTAPRSPSE